MDVSQIEEGKAAGAPVDQRRMLTIVYPVSREEFDWALAHRYLVSTTAEQRAEWGLPQYGDLPVLTPGEVLRVAFADPNDPVHEKFDPSMAPDEGWDPNDPSMPTDERLAQYADEERRVEALITVRTRSAVKAEDLSPEERAPGAEDSAQPAAAAQPSEPVPAAT